MVGGSHGAGSTGAVGDAVAPAHDPRRVAVASAFGTTMHVTTLRMD
jgi:hypothetical protein